MRALLVLSVTVLVGVGIMACGSGDGRVGSTDPRSETSAKAGEAAPAPAGASKTGRPFRGDEDDDDESDEKMDNTSHDNDADFDNDIKVKRTGYLDSDDREAVAYGRAASATEERATTRVAMRYLRTFVAVDGARACTTIVARLVTSMNHRRYGQVSGEPYLRGAKDCATVMSRVFKHFHSELAGSYEITGVRVAGKYALVLLGSRTRPAAFIALEREGDAWKVEGLLVQSLP